MCRIIWQEGTRAVTATAHQNKSWPLNRPDRIREAAKKLQTQLSEMQIPLEIHASSEVMVSTDLEEAWHRGDLLSVADTGKYLLLEMPHNLFVDLQSTIDRFVQAGIHPILAHPEQCPELLHDPERLESWVNRGCFVQVSSGNITKPSSSTDLRALRYWIEQGLVHLIGSDGHSPRRRLPRLHQAVQTISQWGGPRLAHDIAVHNGRRVIEGKPIAARMVAQLPEKRPWYKRFW